MRETLALNDLMKDSYDRFLPAATVMQETHRLTHDGRIFHANHRETGIVNEASHHILLAVPAEVRPHLHESSFSFGVGNIDFQLLEGAEVSAPGTAITAFNANRNSPRTPAMQVSAGPTVTAPGTIIHAGWAPPSPTGVGQRVGWDSLKFSHEWILRPDTNYLLRVVNNSGTALTYKLEMFWYEL